MRPFRFGVQQSEYPATGWRESVQKIESLGFSSVLIPDHFGTQWDPMSSLPAFAAVTQKLKLGALVYDVDYRHPVIYAKAAATLHMISGGRHEFGLGAGWMEDDYLQAGLDYDRPGVRIRRLEEAMQIIQMMWSQESTSFEGEFYKIDSIAQAARLADGERPRILIGGGGKRLLGVAGRHADIVGINPSLPEGRVINTTAADLSPSRVREKIGWVRDAAIQAGRDPDALEFNSLVFVVAMTDDPSGIRQALSSSSGMSEEEVADCPLFLTGPASEIRDRLEKRREETGISYIVIQSGDHLESFAESVLEPLVNGG
ncbi:MAG: TIGR03621 family F420-dependent LLM class oxidoreductase [bacterium]|nr:TIGR03621 family F420-dependent LLM class oxidoreductase [bacterium]